MSAIRRISEDARFRPFLTSHFDAEGYIRCAIIIILVCNFKPNCVMFNIRSVIKDGKSEEVFMDLETCIAEVCYLYSFRFVNI